MKRSCQACRSSAGGEASRAGRSLLANSRERAEKHLYGNTREAVGQSVVASCLAQY